MSGMIKKQKQDIKRADKEAVRKTASFLE